MTCSDRSWHGKLSHLFCCDVVLWSNQNGCRALVHFHFRSREEGSMTEQQDQEELATVHSCPET